MWTSTPSNKSVRRGSRTLLVIAHPDDEAMFFAPLLLALNANHCTTSILCLSTGDFDGLGSKRRAELLKSADCYKIDRNRVNVIDHALLRDGKESNWPPEIIRDLIIDFLSTDDFESVGTCSVPILGLSYSDIFTIMTI